MTMEQRRPEREAIREAIRRRRPKYRLWINLNGDPRFVEVLDGDLGQDEAQRILEEVKDAGMAGTGPFIVSPEWEVRVIGDSGVIADVLRELQARKVTDARARTTRFHDV